MYSREHVDTIAPDGKRRPLDEAEMVFESSNWVSFWQDSTEAEPLRCGVDDDRTPDGTDSGIPLGAKIFPANPLVISNSKLRLFQISAVLDSSVVSESVELQRTISITSILAVLVLLGGAELLLVAEQIIVYVCEHQRHLLASSGRS